MSAASPSPIQRLLARPVDALWRLIVAPRTAALLSVLCALAMALGLVWPQAPWAARGNAQSLAQWQADLQASRGAWLSWPARLGLLTLFTSMGFRLLWALVACGTLVALADAAARWRAARGAQPIPWRLLAHAGLLVLLLAGLVEERWGWEQDRLLMGVERAVAAGPRGSGLTLQRANGSGPAVAIGWQRGAAGGKTTLFTGRPAFIGAQSLHLQEAGLAVRLRALDATGRALSLEDPAGGGTSGPEAVLRFPTGASELRLLSLPTREWVLRIAPGPAGLGDATGGGTPFNLTLYRGLEAAPLAQAGMREAGEMTVDEIRLTWQVLPYASLRVAFHPGLALFALGWTLLLAGLAVAAWGRWPGQGRWAWLWLPAALAFAAGLGWCAAQLRWLSRDAWGLASGLPLAAAVGLALLAGSAALLACFGRRHAAFASWPDALRWAALLWALGGGLDLAGRWATSGALWRWDTGQAWWALGACLLVAAGHGLPLVVRSGVRETAAVVTGLVA